MLTMPALDSSDSKLDKEALLELYPPYTSVLGPYKRNDGRLHVVLNNSLAAKGEKNKTRTISYPKALKEVELGRALRDDETVDHDDRDFTNNRNSNLIVKPRSDHASQDAVRVIVDPVVCPICGTSFIPTVHQRNSQWRHGNPAGPFCSRRCTGKYGASVRNGGEELDRSVINKTYYRLDKPK